jgi:hypothetical protein
VLCGSPVRIRRPQTAHPAWRHAVRALKIAALVALVYEVAFNAFLLSHCLSWVINGNPDALLVEYRTGWSIVPGYVHARGLRIRSKDNGIEFDLRIERCTFHAVLHELFLRRFHVTRVTGDGISFVSRLRITPDAANARTLAEIPQIEGLERMPVKEPDKPPPDDAHYNLWTVALDSVDAESVHEVWLHAFRYVGDARVVGGFYLRPTRWAHVGPASAFIRGGRVTTASYTIVSEVGGRIDATVDPFDPRVTGGIDVFRKGGGNVLLDGTMPSVRFAQNWLGEKGIDVAGGAGEIRSAVHIDHGRLARGTRFRATARDVRLTQDRATGTADLDVSVANDFDRDRGEVRFSAQAAARGLQVAMRDYESAPLRADHAELQVRSKAPDFVEHTFEDALLSVRVPSAEVPDVRVAQAIMGAGAGAGREDGKSGGADEGGGARIEGGRGTVGAELDVERGVGRGRALLKIDGAKVALGKSTVVSGDVRGEVDLRRWSLDAGRVDVGGSRVELLRVKAPGGTDDWWANLQLASGTLDPTAPAQWHSQIVAEARDTRPFIGAFVEGSSLPQWLVPLLTADGLRVRGAVSVGPGEIALRDCIATAGVLHAQATLAKRGDSTSGVAVVASGPLAVGVELRDGGTHVELANAERWYHRKAGER